MNKLLLIAMGGGAGSALRYLTALTIQKSSNTAFPIGTLTVNLIGCLLIGFVGAALKGPWPVQEEYRLALMVGLLGGFTTFSTFGIETFAMLANGQRGYAILNLVLSNVLGVAAVWIAYRLTERWLPASPGG